MALEGAEAYGYNSTMPDSSWWSRTFDGDGVANEFNAWNAQNERSFNAWQSDLDRQFNSIEAAKNRDWQEMMSSTAFQRAVKDAEKAGLNPYLLYTQGGASTPSGSTASSASKAGGGALAASSGRNAQALSSLYSALVNTATLALKVLG